MDAPSADAKLANLWRDEGAAGLDEPGLLLYRSNLLGADLAVTNFGGGNTSVKVKAPDPLTGEMIDVLWVKGSGGDLGSMALDGFATLDLNRLIDLKTLYRGLDQEDEMVALFSHCIYGLNPRAPSIDTTLHAFVPHTHVDHVHPDAVIAIAASKNAEALTRDVFGGRLGFLPWQRPGFDLGLKLGAMAEENPDLVGVVLGGHGLFTWADNARACYDLTIDTIRTANDWLEANSKAPAFGGARVESLSADERKATAAKLMPAIRGRIATAEAKVGHFADGPEVLDFVNSADLDRLALLGTSCPDHFLRTKIRPAVVPFTGSAEDSIVALDSLMVNYRAGYALYYEACKHADSPAIRDPNAVVYLVPSVGMMTFAKDKATARIAGEFYTNAINVMRGAEGVSSYVGLSEQEAFNIEYWLLEEAKLQRMPKPKPLSGRIALVTGAAGGIGRAIARRLMSDGAVVMAADFDAPALDAAVNEFAAEFGRDAIRGVNVDVTDEAAVVRAFDAAALELGGLDILVSNAGIATAAPVEETSLELWNKTMSVLGTGYFLVAREGYRLMQAQGLGGSIVFIGSKNGLAASGGASAYCTAKAAELHLARCLALEGAPHGIRVNSVNPDAVLQGSKIWKGEWRTERAASYGVTEDELEEIYRNRSLLKRAVLPEDIAEGVAFFASDLSSKSTGNILNVDAGNAQAFTR